MKARKTMTTSAAAPAPMVPASYKDEMYALEDAISEEAATHRVVDNGPVGDDRFCQSFLCDRCRVSYPCSFLRWAHKVLGGRTEVRAVRGVIEGEKIDRPGSVQLDSGTVMSVEGVRPPPDDAPETAR